MRIRVVCTVAAVGISMTLLTARVARGHCDTMDGPVVKAGQLALETGDLTPALKWVRAEDEPELRAAFDRVLKIRAKDKDVRDVADQFFLETLVRVHRAGEGAPYTGLKPAGTVEPVIQLADAAIESGSEEKLVKAVTGAVANGIRQRFQAVHRAAPHQDHNVAAGRAFVKAYVTFVHYVEALHAAASGAGDHHGSAEKESHDVNAEPAHAH